MGDVYESPVHAVLDNEECIKIVTGMPKSEQALYIEQEIEKYLKIEDKTVDGEMSRI